MGIENWRVDKFLNGLVLGWKYTALEMRCLIVQTLLIFYLTQNIFSVQLGEADVNRILDYLQQQDRLEKNRQHLESKNILSDLRGIVSGGKNGYQTYQYSWEEDDKSALHDLADDELYPQTNNILKLLSQKTLPSSISKVKPSKNRLISKQGDGDNNAEYSKVYLVMNPRAKINKADLKGIGDIVSQLVLSKQKPKQRNYKGFAVVNDFLTRRRRERDSSEKFTFTKDSIERDYKQKRSRNDYSGGTGRTAIPYIRHRGDIYERP